MIPATVLVVDDREDIVEVQCALLEGAGYTVLEATSAQTALEMLKQFPKTDIMFSDIQLGIGENNGISLARQAHVLYPELKIVLTTGYTPYQLDANEDWRVLMKPYYTETLIEEFDRVMSGEA